MRLKYSHLLNELAGFTSPEEDEFSVAHSLALDEARDMICVADREHNRYSHCSSSAIPCLTCSRLAPLFSHPWVWIQTVRQGL